jgi:hypothetical protein
MRFLFLSYAHSLGESALVAKTIVELAFRNQHTPAPTTASESGSHVTRRDRSSATSSGASSPLSGAESNHAAVATCLEAVLAAAGLPQPASEQHHHERHNPPLSRTSSASDGRSVATHVLNALGRGVGGCPAL